MSIDILRLLETEGRMDLAVVKRRLGLDGDELREAVYELRHLDRIEIETSEVVDHVYARVQTAGGGAA